MGPFHVTLPRRGTQSLPSHPERAQSRQHNALFTQLRKQNKYILPQQPHNTAFSWRESGPAAHLHLTEGLPIPAVFARLVLGLRVHLAQPGPACPLSGHGQWPCGWVLGRACGCQWVKGGRQAQNLTFTDFLLCVGQAESQRGHPFLWMQVICHRAADGGACAR